MVRLSLDDQYITMPWDRIDAVVFDVGNVLMTFRPERVVVDILPEQPEIHTAVLNRTVRTPYWLMLDHGTITQEEAVEAMIGRHGELEEPIRRFMSRWMELKSPVEEGVAALRTCKAHGKKLYVLSNYHVEAFRWVSEQYDFFRLFDGMVVSSLERQLKPNPDIYHTLTSRYGLAPERTLFIDDTPANIEAALTEGWQGLCFNAPGKLSAFFRD
ncbi:MAG: HAD family hydrolase [Aristaeellaceae bacterium]